MSHPTIAVLLVGALVFIFGTVMAVKAYLKNRGEEMAPFRDYFGPAYDRDLLQQSSWCDDESLYNRRTPFDGFNVRDPGTTSWHSRGRGATGRNRDRD
jgi:hypothetical protein